MRLNEKQIEEKKGFIREYMNPNKNAASSSKVDANANVTTKNIATLHAEVHKDIDIQLNRSIVSDKLRELFDDDMAKEYNRQIENHEIYVHDESALLQPYCASVTIYPFLVDGLVPMGGESKAPKHLHSFVGGYINLLYALSSQVAGAIGSPEVLLAFDHFARKDYGDNYLETNYNTIRNFMEELVYEINQPSSARNYQAVFWNIAVFDKYYFEGVFGDFVFPDGSKPNWKSLDKLQKFFLNWLNKERERAILTFPVVTVSMLIDNDTNDYKDLEYKNLIAEQFSKGDTFFIYQSDSPDSISSCCRLSNKLVKDPFQFSIGGASVDTGSVQVITMNINRLIQDKRDLKKEVEKVQKYLVAHREIYNEILDLGMYPIYDAGFVHINKQYLTIGINGVVEAAEYLGFTIDYNEDYIKFLQDILGTIGEVNKEFKLKYDYMINTEYVPAENYGVKASKWDKEDGYFSPRDCYNSYFYIVEDDTNPIDKFLLHGEEVAKYLDGGSALHLNLDEHLSKEGWLKLLNASVKSRVPYWTYNVPATICNECGSIDKRYLKFCSKCKSKNVDHLTRIIGYTKRVSNFSDVRQVEAKKRLYHKGIE